MKLHRSVQLCSYHAELHQQFAASCILRGFKPAHSSNYLYAPEYWACGNRRKLQLANAPDSVTVRVSALESEETDFCGAIVRSLEGSSRCRRCRYCRCCGYIFAYGRIRIFVFRRLVARGDSSGDRQLHRLIRLDCSEASCISIFHAPTGNTTSRFVSPTSHIDFASSVV